MPPIFATFAAGSSKNFGAAGFNRKRGSAGPLGPTPLISYLAVGGGGAGAYGGSPQGGGGGAGGLVVGSNVPVVTTAGVLYTITVGAGGGPGGTPPNRSENGGNGGNTGMFRSDTGAIVFSWCTGGGGGGGGPPGSGGSFGGSGGGGVARGGSGGGGSVPGQGNNGGQGAPGGGGSGGGGGGGAGAPGGPGLDGNVPNNGGSGGIGVTSAITGTTLGYAGGGSGGADFGQHASCFGGAYPASNPVYSPYGASPGSGAASRDYSGGGGSGKAAGGGSNGTNGAGGAVYISYDSGYDDLVLASGATQTIAGGKKIYTFTGSGTASFGSLYSGSNDANGLYGRRYSGNMGTNVNFFGTASLEGTAQAFTTINYNNDLPGGGGGGVNNFSFEWKGYFKPDVSGTWNFRLDTDDTAYLFIGTASNGYTAWGGFTNANGVINNGSAGNNTGSIVIPTANLYYPVRLQFGEGGGDDKIRLYFTPPAGSAYGTSEIQLLTGLFFYNTTSNGW